MPRNLTLLFYCQEINSIQSTGNIHLEISVLRYDIRSVISVCCPAALGYLHLGEHFFKDQMNWSPHF